MRWLLLLLVVPLVTAATLHGTVYNEDLSIASNVLVSIDTQPEQRYLSKDGSYSFNLPPGDYTLTVTYPKYGTNTTTHEDITIVQDGTFTYDLFLFPELEEDFNLLDDLVIDPDELATEKGFPWAEAIALGGLLLIGIIGAVLIPKPKAHDHDLAHLILHEVKKAGGRISQKELRKHLPHSEAKISLVISELEAKNKLEKIKKGRGNILVLK